MGLSQYEETQRVKLEEERLHKKTACLANRLTTPFTCFTPELVCTATTDAVQWMQIYGLLRPTDANDEMNYNNNCVFCVCLCVRVCVFFFVLL